MNELLEAVSIMNITYAPWLEMYRSTIIMVSFLYFFHFFVVNSKELGNVDNKKKNKSQKKY